jgi:environmental stress-induced protein Ves
MVYATSFSRLSGTVRILSVLATMGITAKASWFRGEKEKAL